MLKLIFTLNNFQFMTCLSLYLNLYAISSKNLILNSPHIIFLIMKNKMCWFAFLLMWTRVRTNRVGKKITRSGTIRICYQNVMWILNFSSVLFSRICRDRAADNLRIKNFIFHINVHVVFRALDIIGQRLKLTQFVSMKNEIWSFGIEVDLCQI